MPQHTIFIGFGSNKGERQDLCDRAIALMKLLPLSQVTGVSSYYETEPVDPEGSQGGIWFYNGVVRLETSLSPQRLLDILQETERGLGRDDENRGGPRTMDFDILLFGQKEINQPGLTIPHPRLHQRRFVLEPFVEVDPDYMHPTLHRSMKDLLQSLDDSSQVNKLAITPGLVYPSRPSCSIPPSS